MCSLSCQFSQVFTAVGSGGVIITTTTHIIFNNIKPTSVYNGVVENLSNLIICFFFLLLLFFDVLYMM